MADKPPIPLAQFFFECGYGACYADAIAYRKVEPWPLDDALIERSFVVSREAYEDGAEYDRYRALADAAPELLDALEIAREHLPVYAARCGLCCGRAPEERRGKRHLITGPIQHKPHCAAAKIDSALALARGEDPQS